MVQQDWTIMTQAAWVQDFPLKHSDVSSMFERDLDGYLRVLSSNVDGRRGCPDVIRVRERLVRYDFSSARVALVPCVPGAHYGERLHGFGHMRLRRLLKDVPAAGGSQGTIVCQFSSQGSINDAWLTEELGRSLSACASEEPRGSSGHGAATVASTVGGASASVRPTAGVQSPLNIHIVWPRVNDVRWSLGGYASGSSIPGQKASIYAACVRGRHRVWDGSVSGRQTAMPHMKSFLRYHTDDG
jgi:tyrosyl-DNA phosphodiesterase-1